MGRRVSSNGLWLCLAFVGLASCSAQVVTGLPERNMSAGKDSGPRLLAEKRWERSAADWLSSNVVCHITAALTPDSRFCVVSSAGQLSAISTIDGHEREMSCRKDVRLVAAGKNGDEILAFGDRELCVVNVGGDIVARSEKAPVLDVGAYVRPANSGWIMIPRVLGVRYYWVVGKDALDIKRVETDWVVCDMCQGGQDRVWALTGGQNQAACVVGDGNDLWRVAMSHAVGTLDAMSCDGGDALVSCGWGISVTVVSAEGQMEERLPMSENGLASCGRFLGRDCVVALLDNTLCVWRKVGGWRLTWRDSVKVMGGHLEVNQRGYVVVTGVVAEDDVVRVFYVSP